MTRNATVNIHPQEVIVAILILSRQVPRARAARLSADRGRKTRPQREVALTESGIRGSMDTNSGKRDKSARSSRGAAEWRYMMQGLIEVLVVTLQVCPLELR